MSRNSFIFLIGQKHRTIYMKRVRVTVLTAMPCSTMQTISDYCIAVSKVFT